MAHTHYKGTGKVHSFRGLLTDVAGGNQIKIRIQGAVGTIAWRITKFQVLPETPSTASPESIVKIYREEQSSVTALINFNDNELLGAAYYSGADVPSQPHDQTIIFDNDLFVRNIYVTHIDNDAAININYYIELEEVTVSAAGMAQLAVVAARRRSHLGD